MSATDDFRALGRELSNWGRWGPDDERGTLNHITPERVAGAAGNVVTGEVVDLGIPFDERGPQPAWGRGNPRRLMITTGHEPTLEGSVRVADDAVFMPLQCATQWDALAHIHYDDQLYNGYPASDLGSKGTRRCAISALRGGVCGRGVLLDVAAAHGVDSLDASVGITPEDLEAAARRQRTEIEPGDIVLVRTGWWRRFAEGADRTWWMTREPGLTLACARWLHRHDTAAVAADNWGVERFPSEIPGEALPLHMVAIRDMGMTFGEIFDLEELADACRRRNRWDFLFVGPVLRFTGGVGSPVSPTAIL